MGLKITELLVGNYMTAYPISVKPNVPFKTVVNFANKNKFDLVVGHRGHSSVRELFLGSVANSTVHKSKIPVLVVK